MEGKKPYNPPPSSDLIGDFDNFGAWKQEHFVILATEAKNTLFCPSQEKFHTVVSRGLRNISEAP